MNPGLPGHQLTSKPWLFVKLTNGYVVLSMNVNGAMMPVLGFTNPESLYDFYKDAHKAFIEFVPKPVRDALKVLNQHKDTMEQEEDVEEQPEQYLSTD